MVQPTVVPAEVVVDDVPRHAVSWALVHVEALGNRAHLNIEEAVELAIDQNNLSSVMRIRAARAVSDLGYLPEGGSLQTPPK